MARTGIFVTARLGSQRLAEKHLIKAGGRTFIEWLVRRFHHAFEAPIARGDVAMFVVTSTSPQNRRFEALFEPHDFVTVFYGADGNIPLRHWQCASAHDIDYIVSIDGDDILCSPAAARRVAADLANGRPFVKTIGLPFGMNVMGYSRACLHARLVASDCLEKEKLETGWSRIFDSSAAAVIDVGHQDDGRLRFTLDYDADARFLQQILEHFGDRILTLDDDELIDYVTAEELFNVNAAVSDTYWVNFHAKQSEE